MKQIKQTMNGFCFYCAVKSWYILFLFAKKLQKISNGLHCCIVHAVAGNTPLKVY